MQPNENTSTVEGENLAFSIPNERIVWIPEIVLFLTTSYVLHKTKHRVPPSLLKINNP